MQHQQLLFNGSGRRYAAAAAFGTRQPTRCGVARPRRASAPPPRHSLLLRPCRAEGGGGGNQEGGDASSAAKKQEEYVEALKKGGIDAGTALEIMKRWKEAGASDDPATLRRLFLKQSLVPITASIVQLLFDAGAAYSIFISSSFFALGPPFTGRIVLVYLLDFLAVYFAIGVFFDVVTLTSVVLTTVKLGLSPVAFYEAVRRIARDGACGGGTGAGAGIGSGAGDGLKIVEKAKAAVSAVKVAAALDAIAGLLERSLAANGRPGGAALPLPGSPDASADGGSSGAGAALRSIDTLSNLSAYLTLNRAEAQGFDPATVGLSEAEAANIALVFGQADLNDDGRIDAREFAQLLSKLVPGGVSDDEAGAAMETIDTNKDGAVSFEEFLKFWAARKEGKGGAGR